MISDSDWIIANPDRRLRLRQTFEAESHQWGEVGCGAVFGDPNLQPAVLIEVLSRRPTWLESHILTFGAIADTDEAIAAAEKQWGDVLLPRLHGAARRRAADE